MLEDDDDFSVCVDNWMSRTTIAVLGAGKRPLLSYNKSDFKGLEGIGDYEAVNIDIRDYPTPEEVAKRIDDLSNKL